MSDNPINTKKPLRLECVNPILNIKDMSVSRHFYIDILGFKEADWGTDEFTSVNRDNTGIYLCKNGQGQPGTWLWIGFDGDIFALRDELQSKSVVILHGPVNYSYAYEMHVQDPDGHVLRFGTDPDYNQAFADPPVFY